MAEKTINPKKISSTNTKKQLLDAYEDLVKQITEQREAQLRPEEKIREREMKKAVDVADSLSMKNVESAIASLRGETGRLLAELSERLEAQIADYEQIKRAIQEKKIELEEIYEIEKSAHTLAALIEAHNQKTIEFEEDMAVTKARLEGELGARKLELESQIAEAKARWETDKRDYEHKLKEESEAEAKRRNRVKEEFEYEFERQKRLANDQFNYEKETLEKELKETRRKLEDDFSARERELEAREAELSELRDQVAKHPKELAAEIARAVKETTDRISSDAKNREELLVKEFEGERNVFAARVSALEGIVKDRDERLARLTTQAEKAGAQVQDIAVKAIEGSSNLKSFEHLREFVSDQSRKSTTEK